MCHVSHVTCQVFLNFLFWQSGEAHWWRVCYQQGLPRLVLGKSGWNSCCVKSIEEIVMTIDFTACHHLFFAIMLCFNLWLSLEEEFFTTVSHFYHYFSCLAIIETVTYTNTTIVLTLSYCIVPSGEFGFHTPAKLWRMSHCKYILIYSVTFCSPMFSWVSEVWPSSGVID